MTHLRHAAITFFSREIHSVTPPRCRTIHSQHPAMMRDLFEQESNMSNKLLGAAAMAALIFAVAPASAASMRGCSGTNLTKTESAIEAMADGEGKTAAQKQVAQAQEAMLKGNMGECASHLSKAMHAGMMK
jgi:hypothetical protein